MEQKKKKLSEMEDLVTITGKTKIPAYDGESKKTGMISALTLISKNLYCGCRWKLTNSSPVGEPEGDIDMLRELPAILALGGYLVSNDHSRKKLSASTHYEFADGGTAKLDGSMGHYQWGWGTNFYLSVFDDSTYHHERIGLKPITGAWNWKIPVASRAASGFSALDRTNNILVSYCNKGSQYRGCTNDASLDSAFNSMLGCPVTNVAETSLEAYAEKNGARWAASHVFINTVTYILCRIIFRNKNIQASYNATLTSDGLHQGGLGEGCANKQGGMGHWGWIPMDAGADLGDALGTFSYTQGSIVTTGIPNFFGLKNFYHNLWAMLHGVVLNGTGSQWDVYGQRYWNSNAVAKDSISGLIKLGSYPKVDTDNWYYPKSMNIKNLVMYPKELGGSASTFECDGAYLLKNTTTVVRGLGALARAHSGAYAGSGALFASYGPSVAYEAWGAFLCEAAEDWDSEPFMG